jgi:hypothetical protein
MVEFNQPPRVDEDPPAIFVGGVFAEIAGWPILVRKPSRYELIDGRWEFEPTVPYAKVAHLITSQMDA